MQVRRCVCLMCASCLLYAISLRECFDVTRVGCVTSAVILTVTVSLVLCVAADVVVSQARPVTVTAAGVVACGYEGVRVLHCDSFNNVGDGLSLYDCVCGRMRDSSRHVLLLQSN